MRFCVRSEVTNTLSDQPIDHRATAGIMYASSLTTAMTDFAPTVFPKAPPEVQRLVIQKAKILAAHLFLMGTLQALALFYGSLPRPPRALWEPELKPQPKVDSPAEHARAASGLRAQLVHLALAVLLRSGSNSHTLLCQVSSESHTPQGWCGVPRYSL